MKTRSLVLIGLLSCLFFAIAFLPASLVWRFAGNSLTAMPVAVEQVGGTVWNGFLKGRVRSQALAGPVVVQWNVQGLRLLLGEAALVLKVEGAEFRVGGSGYWGLWGKGLAGLNGDMQASLLQQMLAQFGVSAEGIVKLTNVNARLRGTRFTVASGTLTWSGGTVAVRNGPNPQTLNFPGIKGELAETDGNLIMHVTETQHNKPLGELSLMPEQGLAGVKVLKRVMALAGMGNGGDEDKVLISMQQPLPF